MAPLGSTAAPHRPRRLRLLAAAVGPALLMAFLAVLRPPFLDPLDSAVYDTVLRLSRTGPPGDRVVIVNVDERSLSTLGQWPWPRDLMGRLVAQLRDLGAAAIGLDIVFAEPDRYAGRPDARASSTTDQTFARAIRGGKVVLGYVMTFDGTPTPEDCVLHPLRLTVIEAPSAVIDAPVFQADGAICNLPVLAEAADASGFLNAVPDPDGTLRRVPLLIELGDRRYPSLALATVMIATGSEGAVLRVANPHSATLAIGDRTTIPLDGVGNLLVRFRGRRNTLPHLSAADVLEGRTDMAAIRNKVVFVGTTALGAREVVASPLDTLFSGVEVQATVADNLLTHEFVARHEFGYLSVGLLTLMLGVWLAAMVTRAGLVRGAFAGLLALVACWAGAAGAVSMFGVFFSPLFPTLAIALSLTGLTVASLTIVQERVRDTSLALESANLDALTGVPNRRAFNATLWRAFSEAHPDAPLSLFFVDVDHFKRFNDTYGHGVGDRALTVFARTLDRAADGAGQVFRIGGEEFAVVCPNLSRAGSSELAERLLAAIAGGARITDDDGSTLSVGCSIGIATHDGAEFQRPETLLQAADRGLYAAKAAGRGCARRGHGSVESTHPGGRRGHRPAS